MNPSFARHRQMDFAGCLFRLLPKRRRGAPGDPKYQDDTKPQRPIGDNPFSWCPVSVAYDGYGQNVFRGLSGNQAAAAARSSEAGGRRLENRIRHIYAGSIAK